MFGYKLIAGVLYSSARVRGSAPRELISSHSALNLIEIAIRFMHHPRVRRDKKGQDLNDCDIWRFKMCLWHHTCDENKVYVTHKPVLSSKITSKAIHILITHCKNATEPSAKLSDKLQTKANITPCLLFHEEITSTIQIESVRLKRWSPLL